MINHLENILLIWGWLDICRGRQETQRSSGRTADNCRCNTRFSGAASGKNLRYQWQKNGVKILGEASPSHLTSPTTLWGTGSPARRSVSNSSGTTRSRFGIKDREVSADFLG